MREGHDFEALGTDGCSAERRNDVKSPSSLALGLHWARKEAEAIVAYLPADQAAAIDYVAAALQRVADECAAIVEKPCSVVANGSASETSTQCIDRLRVYVTLLHVTEELRARFPKEEK